MERKAYTTEKQSDASLAWKKLYTRLEEDGLLEQTGKKRRVALSPMFRAAALVLLLLSLGIPSLFLFTGNEEHAAGELRHFAEQGVKTLDLPDGSRVFLNEGSSIEYKEDFSSKRSLELEGEAYFEVMSDPVNPFTVQSGKILVSVLGTSFNVKENKESSVVEVLVESGKVRMANRQNGDFIDLEPGQLGRNSRQDLNTLEPENKNYLSWKTKDFKFVDDELLKVLTDLESAYHVDIKVDENLVADMRITSTYREQSIDSILETIATAFSLELKKEKDQYVLEP